MPSLSKTVTRMLTRTGSILTTTSPLSPLSPLPPSSDPGFMSSSPTPSSPSFRQLPTTPTTKFPRNSGARTPMTPMDQLINDEFGEHLPSSIVQGTKAEKSLHRRQKAHCKQAKTLGKKRKAMAELSEQARDDACRKVLSSLASKNLCFLDLLNFISNPEKRQGIIRWQQLFVHHGAVAQILDWWVSPRNSDSAREQVSSWAAKHIASCVAKEAEHITSTGALQTLKRSINRRLVSAFSLSEYTDCLKNEWAPTMMNIISAFATSPYASSHKSQRREKTEYVKTIVALMCLGEWSRNNNLIRRMLGLYLYASGAPRQTISVLSKLGLCESYSTLVSTRLRRFRTKKDLPTSDLNSHDVDAIVEGQRLGTLYQLSDSVRREARAVAATGLYAVVYDNINMGFLNSEQILGRHDSQENGTCATLFTLSGPADEEDLNISKFQEAFLGAPSLSINDIILSPSENREFKENLLATILRIIIEYGGDDFQKFKSNMTNFQPKSNLKPEKPTRTEIYPLTSWEIDESSILGNIEVVNAITKELNLEEQARFLNRVRFMAGDQLSMSRLRSIETICAGHEKAPEDYFWGVNILGLFHTKIADTHGLLLTHFGKANAGTSNPGSLAFHNTRLDRLPITVTSPPPFRVCRDLIFVSLYARILHCLLLVSNCTTLENYLKTHGTWELLVLHAREILDRFTKAEVVEDLRWQRELSMRDERGEKSKKPEEGDMVFENAVLFLRDALISCEFSDAIKANDPGRIILVLKTFALSFRGNGRLKYAYEMLHFIHNIKHVWPESIRRIVLNNLVLNPSGLPESGVEVDLLQEHINLLAKDRFKARGSNASWDWMSMITPCCDALRQLQQKMHRALGNDIGSKHASAHLADDIQSLMDSLLEHKVYTIQRGRVTDDDDPPVPDVINTGLHHLSNPSKSPINDYNVAFRKLQQRRRMTPVSTEVDPSSSREHASESVNFEGVPTPSVQHNDVITNNDINPEPQSHADTSLPEELDGHGNELLDVLEGDVEEDTLPRLSMQDVAFDMDVLEDEGSDSDGDLTDEDGK